MARKPKTNPSGASKEYGLMIMTPAGVKALRDGDYDDNPVQALGGEIIARCTAGITADNVRELIVAVLEQFGSVEAALRAVRSGEIQFQEAKPH
jgi:hypothetical protein